MKSLTQILNESSTLTLKQLAKIVNERIQKSKLTTHRYSDTDWRAVKNVVNEIGTCVNELREQYDVQISFSRSVRDGGYETSTDGTTQTKVYHLQIDLNDKTLYGVLNAHACGTTDDPFSSYDISCYFST